MIKFYGKYKDEEFEFDLSDTRITFLEENPMFFDYLIKNYTLPFRYFAKDASKIFGFIDLKNIDEYNSVFEGKLVIDNLFFDAELRLLKLTGEYLEGKFTYGRSKLRVMNKKLSDLNFPKILMDDVLDHANKTIRKNYPETDYNYPMIIDNKIKENENYEAFEGIVNNYSRGRFMLNSKDKNKPINRNHLTPFPYLMAILRVAFEEDNMILSGDFVNDLRNQKMIWYTEKFIEKYNGKVNVFQNDFSLSETLPEMDFSTFLRSIKNFFNLDISITENFVNINYINRKLKSGYFVNHSVFENEKPLIEFNNGKVFCLSQGKNQIYVSSNGVVEKPEQNIYKIKMDVEFLKSRIFQRGTTAYNSIDVPIKLILYDGVQNSKPATITHVEGMSYSLMEVYEEFWMEWLKFRTRSEKYKDKFISEGHDFIRTAFGLFKYNKKHLIKKIKKKRIGLNLWEFAIESETINP